ncbi:MAG: glutathione synthetase [Candidatus Cyclobacteriaceae bacterium M3_2C_046]
MNIVFVVNNIQTEISNYTTTFLARQLHNQNHKAFYVGVEDLFYHQSGHMGGFATQAPEGTYDTNQDYLSALQSSKAGTLELLAPDIDVIWLRNDPSIEGKSRSWAASAGIVFSQIALNDGVIVLNDPNSLSQAANKMYFQHFPEQVRPKTLISRNPDQLRQFFDENGGKMILKPLQGSGGKGVFIVKKENLSNLNQVIESISRDGYVIAQEFLPLAKDGDIRLFVMNGEILQHQGKYAAFKRQSAGQDIRNNIHSGGTVSLIEIDDQMRKIVDQVRPKLVKDGMFLVGLDVVGDKLLEINVFTPGGLSILSDRAQVDFSVPVIDALIRKVAYHGRNQQAFDNAAVASKV